MTEIFVFLGVALVLAVGLFLLYVSFTWDRVTGADREHTPRRAVDRPPTAPPRDDRDDRDRAA